MKVAGYMRVSTDKEGQKESPENQRQLILNYIFENGLDLHDLYLDVQTGTTDKRDGLKQMIKDAENGLVEVIVAKELSRLGRNVELLYTLKRICEVKGVRLITLDGIVDTADPQKLAMFGLFAWIYEGESQRTSDRIKSVFKLKHQQGKYINGLPPYGYASINGKLQICDDGTPEVVRNIFNKFISGMSITAIARELNETGVPTSMNRNGTKKTYWGSYTISVILKNRVYIGDFVWGKKTTASVVSKKVIHKDESKWGIIEGNHEALIPIEKFEIAQKMLLANAAKGRGKVKVAKSLFTNFIYCEDCGRSMWKRSGYYDCGTRMNYGKKMCTCHAIKEEKLVGIILSDLEKLKALVDDKKYLETFRKKAEKLTKRSNRDKGKLLQERDTQVSLKSNALQKFVMNEISKEEYNFVLSVANEKIQVIEEKLSKLTSANEDVFESEFEVLKKSFNLILNFDNLTREILHCFVNKITVSEDREITIYYKFDFINEDGK